MSHRNFGIMSGRASLSGGSSTDTSASSAKQYYRADSNVVFLADRAASQRDWPNSRGSNPALFIPSTTTLERSEFSQTLLDILAVLTWFLLCSVTGVGIAFSLFILLFVKVS